MCIKSYKNKHYHVEMKKKQFKSNEEMFYYS